MKQIAVSGLPQLLEAMAALEALYLPVQQGRSAQFTRYEAGMELSQDLNTGRSAKDLFFPQVENLVDFQVSGKNIEVVEHRDPGEDFILFGVRACDCRSFDILDRVFLSEPQDTFYASRRSRATVVTLACHAPEETCFCTVFGIDPADPTIEEIVSRWGGSGLGINISNTEYDETTDKLADAYTAKNVNYADVLAAMVKYIAAAKSEFLATAQSIMSDADYSANVSALTQYAINEAFTDLIYLVNDDDGMFSSDSYQVTPDGTATSYVEEYAVLARRLYKEADDSVRAEMGKMALEDYGTAMYSGTTSETSFNNDAFAEAKSVAYTIYVKDMTSVVADGRTIDAPVYTFVTEDGSISFIINTYGIQIVMINGYAFDETAIGSTVTAVTEGDHTWYQLTNDYLYSVEVIVNYQLDDEFSYALDDDGNRIISSIEVESKTLSQYVSDTLLDGKKTDNYNTVVNEFVGANEQSCVTKNDKVFNKLLDSIAQA